MGRLMRRIALLIAGIALLQAAPAAAAEPQLTVPRAKLAAAFHCSDGISNAAKEPILLSTGDRRHGRRALRVAEAGARPLPAPVLLRRLPRLHDRRRPGLGPVPRLRDPQGGAAGRPPAGDLRDQPGGAAAADRADLLAEPRAEGDRRDRRRRHPARTNVEFGEPCSASNPCAPAIWQQAAGSNFLRALNSQPRRVAGPDQLDDRPQPERRSRAAVRAGPIRPRR